MQIENLFNSIRNNQITLQQFKEILKSEFNNCENSTFDTIFDSYSSAFDYFLVENNLNYKTLNLSAFASSQYTPSYFEANFE
jgi:predicted TPR repeat methyltransferase